MDGWGSTAPGWALSTILAGALNGAKKVGRDGGTAEEENKPEGEQMPRFLKR